MSPGSDVAVSRPLLRAVCDRISALNGLWLVAGLGIVLRLAGSFLQFALFVLLARLMVPEEFGKLGWAYGLAMVLAVVAGLGQGPLVARCWHLWARDPGRLRAAIRGLRVSYAATLLGSMAVVAALVSADRLELPVFPSPDIAAAASLLVAVYTLSELQSFAMRADDRIVAGLAPRDVGWRFVVMIFAIALNLAHGPPGAFAVLTLMVLSLLVLVGLQGAFWWWDLRQRAASEPAGRPGPFDWRSWRTLSLSVWSSSIGTVFVQHADVALVGWALGPVEAAVYIAAARTSQILQLLPTALTAVLIPQVSRTTLERGHRGLSDIVAVNNRIVFLPASVATLVLLAVPEPVLMLFGAPFAGAETALRILAAGHLIAILCGPIVSICVGAGYQHAYALAVGAGAVLLVAGILLLAPRFGIAGAASASALATAAPSLVLRLWLRRRTGLDTSRLGR